MASVFGFGLFSHGVLSSFLPVRRFSSGAAPFSRFAASLFRDFSEGPSLFSFSGTALLLSDSTLKCLFPFNAHLRLNRIRCRRISGRLFLAIFTKGAELVYFILSTKGTGKCPYRPSDSHALSDSLKSRMPIVRRTRTLYRLVVYLHSKYVFGFFETYVSSAGSPAKRGFFCSLNRFFIDSFLLPYPFPFFVSLFVKLFFTL